MSAQQEEREGNRYGVRRAYSVADHKTLWHVPCCGCDAVMTFGTDMPISIVLKKSKAIYGWMIDKGHAPLCADCIRKDKEKKAMIKTDKTLPLWNHPLVEQAKAVMPKTSGMTRAIPHPPEPSKFTPPLVTPMTGATPSVPIQGPSPSPRIQRKVYELLTERFNDETGRYDAGWSDERIAKEIGCHIGVVENARRVAYAELAEDPELERFRDELQAVREEMEQIDRSHGKTMAAFADKIARLDMRIEKYGVGRKIAVG